MRIINLKKRNVLLGQSLYEVVFAIGIAAIIITGVVVLATRSISNSTFSKNNSQATKYTQEQLEWLRSQRDGGWSTFLTSIGGSCTGENYSWGSNCTVGDIYTRTASYICSEYNPGPPPTTTPRACSDSRVNFIEVTVGVSWSDSSGSHSVKSNTTFTNWNR